MKKKIDVEKFLNTNKLADLLKDVSNSTPKIITKTFNFKGRKSPIILQKIIQGLSNPQELILDPFLGSGSTLIAALQTRRSFEGIELDNYTYNVLSVLFSKVDNNILNKYFESIKRNIYFDIQSLYSTEVDGQEIFVKKILFDPKNGKEGYFKPKPNREIKNGNNIKFVKKMNDGRSSKRFSNYDWEKLLKIDSMDTSDFPRDKYIANSRINITSSTGADNYGAIFTKRAKVALLKIQSEISALPKSNEKRFLQFVLVSALTLTRVAQYGSSSDVLYQVMNEKAQEMNAWEQFENKFKVFKNFQAEYRDLLVTDFKNNSEFNIVNTSYNKKLKSFKGGADAIVTDFPYTDQVPYLERNQLYRIWLQHYSDDGVDYSLTEEMLENEMVVTNAPTRPNKDMDHYYSDLDLMMKCFSDAIKDYGQVAFILNFGKNNYFNMFAKLINFAKKNGFEYVSRMDIKHTDYSLRKQSAYENTLMEEAVIIFVKLPKEKQYFYIQDNNYEKFIIDNTYSEIETSEDKSVPLNKIILKFISDIEQKGITSSDKIDQIKNVIYDNFYIDIERHTVGLDPNELYLDQVDNRPNELLNRIIDLVPRYVSSLLKNYGKFTLEDLYLMLIDKLIDGKETVFEELVNDSKSIKAIKEVLDDYTDRVDGYYVAKRLPSGFTDAVKDLNMMDPYDFERLVKSLFVKKGYTNVIRKGGAGDLGVDIIADKSNDNGKNERWLIQVKRWAHNVGSEPLQRLVSERQRIGAQKAIVVTTADFTSDAQFVSDNQEVLMMNGNQLITELEKIWPGKYIKLLNNRK